MKNMLPHIKKGMVVLWVAMLVNIFIAPFPQPAHLILVLLFGATLIGHSAICFGYRIKHNKSIPETKYRDLLLYGVFELMDKDKDNAKPKYTPKR